MSGSEKKKSRKLTFREILITLICMVVIAGIVIVVTVMIRDISTRKLEKAGKQYYGGAVRQLEAGSSLKKGEDGNTVLENNGTASKITELPIYYDEESRLTVTSDMIYYTPRDLECRQVPHFTDLYLDTYGGVHAVKDGKDIALKRGFLFDGKNMYIFMEPVKLYVNGHDYQLPVLSYVDTGKDNNISVFNHETKDFIFIIAEGEATAEAAEQDYKLYLRSDTMETSDGVKQLLYTRPDLLDPIGQN